MNASCLGLIGLSLRCFFRHTASNRDSARRHPRGHLIDDAFVRFEKGFAIFQHGFIPQFEFGFTTLWLLTHQISLVELRSCTTVDDRCDDHTESTFLNVVGSNRGFKPITRKIPTNLR